MPRASQHKALARQWELLKHVPSRGPGKTAKELTDLLERAGYRVDKRTVERDLQELSTLFALVRNEKGTPYGWKWMPGEELSLPALSVSEALSVRMVEDLLRPLLPAAILEALEPRFRQAEANLGALSAENAHARWVDKVRHVSPNLPLLPSSIAEGVLETVQEALLRDQQVEVRYLRPAAAEPASLVLHPLGLVQRGPTTYLVATAYQYTDVRLYAVHRMHAAALTGQPCVRPVDFSLDDYVARGGLQFCTGTSVDLELRVTDDEVARVLAETRLSADQVIDGGQGNWTVRASLPDTQQLRWWLLSQGSRVEVMAPATLREALACELAKAAARYCPARAPGTHAP